MIIAKRASAIICQYLKHLQLDVDSVVVIPSNVCIDLLLIIEACNLKYRFIDLNRNLDDLILEIEKTDNVLIYTHLYGNEETPTKTFKTIKDSYPKIKIIDDRCLCTPSLIDPDFNSVDLIVYSTGEKKQVNLGEYGYAFCNDSLFAMNFINENPLPIDIERIRNLLISRDNIKPIVSEKWIDFRKPIISESNYLDQIQNSIENISSTKDKITKIYKENIPQELWFDDKYQGWRFNLKIRNPKLALKKIFDNNLFASRHYFPLNTYFNNQCPNSIIIYNHVINLFIDNYISEKQAVQLSKLINEIYTYDTL